MSIRAYRLLRNNKEEGPFTAEEIIQKTLRQYDLIWMDGRSAAWSYPGEMAEFKMYVPLPGEENVTLSASKRNSSSTISSSVQAAIAMNNNIAEPAIKQQKPRYKISAAWNKIQTVTTPAYTEAVVAEPKKKSVQKIVETKQPLNVQSKSLSWEEAWLDWEKEKKIMPVFEAAKQKSSTKPQAKALNENYIAPALETKYTEPLDSIKDRYIDNLLQQKQKTNKSLSPGKASEFIIPSVALLIIFSVGYWLLHNTNETASALSSLPVKTEQPAKKDTTNAFTANNNVVSNTAMPNSDDKNKNVISTNEPAITDQAEDRKINFVHPVKFSASKETNNSKDISKLPSTQVTLPDSKSTAQKSIDNAAKQFDPPVINNVPANNANNSSSTSNTNDLNTADARSVQRRTNTDDNAGNSSTQQNEVAATKPVSSKSSASYVSVPEYIQMNDGSADLKIENISDVNLDLVVVNVEYYDASNRFRKGETLYLHNLRAGKNVIVKTPRDDNSQYAVSKVSLVSSDANNIYMVGDN